MCDQQASPCKANAINYYIDMPANYDQNKPYPVVFQYHPLGGSGQGARTQYGVRPNFMDAIYVSPDGSENGFPNTGDVDEEATRAIMETIETNLCVDKSRYFATGFSYGGSMSYTAACNMSDKFRAIAAMAGAPISGARCTSMAPERPVAVLGIHGEADTVLRMTLAIPMKDVLVENNGCTTETMPSEPEPDFCVAYQGCNEGYPVIWCPVPGLGHSPPSWSREAIPEFFKQF